MGEREGPNFANFAELASSCLMLIANCYSNPVRSRCKVLCPKTCFSVIFCPNRLQAATPSRLEMCENRESRSLNTIIISRFNGT